MKTQAQKVSFAGCMAVALLSMSGTGNSQDAPSLDMQTLLLNAQSPSSTLHLAVGGIGRGVLAASEFSKEQGSRPIFCPAQRLRTGDYVSIVSDYVAKDPTLLKLPSTEIARTMVLALRSKFPCAN